MKLEGEIISKEIIKPSSPTPDANKIHNLSLLDQIVPPFFAPMVFYYPNLDCCKNPNQSISQTTQILKQSLSETLTRFYPLAGRIRDDLSIDCNDEGVLFVVARFHKSLSDFLKRPDPSADLSHIPGKLSWDEPGPRAQVAMVQVNYYDCGGVVIGLLFYHKLADGLSMATFMKDWAANTRDPTVLLKSGPGPSFDFHSLFPHNSAMQRESHLFTVMKRYFKIGKPVIRRYVFDAEAISILRARLPEHDGLIKHDRPTRVEVVTALMWKCFMIACAAANKDSKSSVSLVSHVVGLRKKAEPQFPEDSFGNFVWLGPASSTNNGPDRDLEKLFGKVRSAIRSIDSDFVKRMEGGGDGFSGYLKNVEGSWKKFPEKADYLAISSWCNFGLYGVDFGWGRPVWITKCDSESDREWPYLNVLWLMDMRRGDGVEAWLNLDEKYSAAFDENHELRDLAKISPSPLDMAGIM